MPNRGSPLFLERRSYRLRRLMDAVRLMPLIGIGLWMIPLLWPAQEAAADAVVPMSQALLYVFIVWMTLILVSVVFWWLLRRAPSEPEGAPGSPDWR